jgi:hypothetical protein
MTNNLQPIDRFSGDFEFLPVAAHLRYGAIPVIVTSSDFQLAAVRVSADLEVYAEAHWHLEAVRERRLNPSRSLNDAMRDINDRVARRLYERTVR